jgi:5-methylcytosine-specific restriction endonuclease McrA
MMNKEAGGAAFNEAITRALVLNSSYEPLKIVSWQKAIILWFQGKVEVIEHHDHFVSSVSQKFQLPSIIRLKSYVRIRNQNVVRFCRENIYKRDRYICQYCESHFSPKDLTLDHVVPVSKGGGKSWTNIVTACRECNQRKANRTPVQAEMPLKVKPREPLWIQRIECDVIPSQAPDSWKVYLADDLGSVG